MSAAAFTQDDFDAWKELAMTRLVISAAENIATLAEEHWKAGAYSSEYLTSDERERQLIALNRVKARNDGMRALAEITLEDVLAANGLEPAQEGQ